MYRTRIDIVMHVFHEIIIEKRRPEQDDLSRVPRTNKLSGFFAWNCVENSADSNDASDDHSYSTHESPNGPVVEQLAKQKRHAAAQLRKTAPFILLLRAKNGLTDTSRTACMSTVRSVSKRSIVLGHKLNEPFTVCNQL